MRGLSALWEPVQRGVHHLVESGIHPKGGAPISAIEAQTWAHISRKMVVEGEIKESLRVELDIFIICVNCK
jgi:hypothetical protein